MLFINKKAYCLKNVAMKVISNDGFKEIYDKINIRIDEYIQMVFLLESFT